MNESELAEYLGLPEGTYGDGGYTISLNDSDEYGRYFSVLDNNTEDLNELPNNQLLTDQGSSNIWEVEDQPYIINLLANWETDEYQIIISKIK